MQRILLAIVFAVSALSVANAQQPAASPEPMKQLQVPEVAPDFKAPPKPLPELNRVGVDMNQSRPLSLREALTMALENNKDIEWRARTSASLNSIYSARTARTIRGSRRRLFTSASRARFRAFLPAARTAPRFRAITPALRVSKDRRQSWAAIIVWISRR